MLIAHFFLSHQLHHSMNHAVPLDTAEAGARWKAYQEQFPQKRLPARFEFDPVLPVADNLDKLALFALHHDTTLPVLYAYRPVFLDLVARWTERPADFERAYCQLHSVSEPHTPGSIILLALAGIVRLFPEGSSLVEKYVRKSHFLDNADSLAPALELQSVLLALFRIYSDKPLQFQPYIIPHSLHQILQLSNEYAISKYLAIRILSIYLNASEISQSEMVTTHIGSASLYGTYGGNDSIDYTLLDLVEAKRLSNFTALPLSIGGEAASIVNIDRDLLSSPVVSICGVLVAKLHSDQDEDVRDEAVATENSVKVLRAMARMVQKQNPIMLYGKAGSGKTFLINQLARYFSCQNNLVKLHLGEQTDAKLLLGTYTSGDKPGSFQWRSGVLTTAVKEGRWVLVEDIDKAPTEVLSILLTLLEKRELSIPSRGEVIRAHSDFQLLATIRTLHESKVPDMIGLRLWDLLEVEAPSEMELRRILVTKFPILKNLIAKFVTVYNRVLHIYSMTSFISLNKGSHPRVISTRDLMKFCFRCNQILENNGVKSADSLLETAIYENMFAEAVDCFGSAITEHGALVPLVDAIGEILEVPLSRITLFLDNYVPTLYLDDEKVEIGRAVLHKSAADKALYVKKKSGNTTNFAKTKHSKRLMEQIGVAVEMMEPVLLVGETGTGKTTVVQEVAKMMNKKLTVINVSQQTETGDLLGGYKPVNTKTIALPLQESFENLFLATFSQKRNAKFSALLTKCFNRNQWKNVTKLWKEAVKMANEILSKVEDSDEEVGEDGGPKKKRKLGSSEKSVLLLKWAEFKEDVEKFEHQASNIESSFVFSFVEGSLIKSVRNGEWLLLDEINLASPDTLDSISDLLSEVMSLRSILLGERGDVQAIMAHPDFRIFGCMNPSTDVGKRDLPLSIRSRFSEIYVHSPDKDREDLLNIIAKYIERYTVGDEWAINDIAELYTEAKRLAEANKIVDGANQKPHFSIRTLTRTLIYVRDIVSVYGLRRSLYEGFCMAFLTLLDQKSEEILKTIIAKYTIDKLKNAKAIINRCPPPPTSAENEYVQFRHYWMKSGPGEITTPNYIITPFVEKNLLNLVRATASRRFPVLVQGPTSAGKTSMINYLASITGHKFVRINNHEHTDLQEYLGTYVSDSSGKLVFREGVLVEALRKGHWIVLDELNLAPTDVLEALNRLLDDNRELFIPETQEIIHPHPDFMLFATQNPPGLYGGRKVLSRAFRNRFLELHFDDIPQDELEIILKERCQIAPSYGKKIVEVYKQLSVRRQSSRLFEQKNSFATLRDLFRWAMREAVGYEELAANGYMLLAERVRSKEEKLVVKETIEKVMRVKLDMDAYYQKLENPELFKLNLSIVWTKAMRRLAVLVETSIKYKEPLLLVGETGCGKTTICQILAAILEKQLITVNAHQNTETGDILGAQRPLRNRFELRAELLNRLIEFFLLAKVDLSLTQAKLEDLVKKFNVSKKKIIEDASLNIDAAVVESIEEQIKNSSVLFEWVDGPLIQAMKSGDFFLLDEISLADDSVLERLNSVLEPERSLLLAEKGTEDAFLIAEASFQFLATMNPGGDYGKKELSPALRNRFTEIWVPSMDDFNDVKQIVSSRLLPEFTALCEPLVNFSEWFGQRLGNSQTNNGVISLRDILAWVEFINSCASKIDGQTALINGALMVFIDGLGTNNTAYLAENEEKLFEYKRECLLKLGQFSGIQLDASSYFEKMVCKVEITLNVLRAGEFEIPRVSQTTWEESFNLLAPTSAANAMRVLRAMQVAKPILLEGSPGVGKTSLVSAISQATGNKLVRINLSEQTDLIDLFGSDAPVEGGQTGEFVWRDAPFLRAMKNGEWVLLDEMNLASQSVLEGLNACLDHRGEAYIPELDKSFPRHPDFKVFAAQNPQYQGGGRKGLPKSFVNRFSVVYMDVLKTEDLILISQQMFPQIPEDECVKVITFMSTLENEIVVKKKWGVSGGPWEFNLRDTLRWLRLYTSSHNLRPASDLSLSDFLNMIISQRFRSPEDRLQAETLFLSIFGSNLLNENYYGLSPDCVQFGGSVIKRSELLQYANSSDRLKHVSLQCNLPALESAARSVNENIPLILTGPTNSGKTELVRFLANVVGVQLREFAMNSDVDSMDILGGYEQVDLTRAINILTEKTYQVLNQLSVINLRATTSDSDLLKHCLELIAYMDSNNIESENFTEFMIRFDAFTSLYSNEDLSELSKSGKALKEKLEETSTVKFEWFDGLLVQAVTRGDWLVLDNANLCNPSVLDRLNSLLETNGSLIINECSEADGTPRLLVPHPNFRLFLTVNPKYGELSRAMRNRCVEVYMDSLDARGTSFDKSCLGLFEVNIEGAENSNIDEMVSNLRIKEQASQARPMTAFAPANNSAVRILTTFFDSISLSEEKPLAGALAGMVLISSLKKLKAWIKTVESSEFSSKDKIAVEEVASVAKSLQTSGYSKKLISLYHKSSESQIVTAKFADTQVLHPFVNRNLLGYFTEVEHPSSLKATMLLQTCAGILQGDALLSNVEQKAIHGKLSDLSFLEKSTAVHLGREMRKAPKIKIYAYVRAVAEFISKVFQSSVETVDIFDDSVKIYSSLAELQTLWRCLLRVCHEQNISKLRIYHDSITAWLKDNMFNPIVKENSELITTLRIGLELTSGFSMSKIWEKFRQLYPNSELDWNNYVNLVALLNDFDILTKKLYPDTYSGVVTLRKQMLGLYNEIISNTDKKEQMSEVFQQFSDSVKNLVLIAESFTIGRSNNFLEEFTTLSNFVELSGYFNGFDLEKHFFFASYSNKSTLSLIKGSENKLLLPYPRLLDSLWLSDLGVRNLITSDLLNSTLNQSHMIKSCPGKFLEQNLADLATLSKLLIENSQPILESQVDNFKRILLAWITEIFEAHEFTMLHELQKQDFNTIDVKNFIQSILEQADAFVGSVVSEFFAPALYLIVNSTDLGNFGKAWILFSGGCVQLFVPNSPLDPAIEDHVTAQILQEQQQMFKDLIRSWKSIGKVVNGDKASRIENDLPQVGNEDIIKPQVFRKNESIDDLFEEWSAFMSTSLDLQPIKNLIDVAENLTVGDNAQRVGLFHKNAANFMLRLGSKYFIYADLNEILNGYIYGIKLGLDLISVQSDNAKAVYQIDSMWSLDVGTLLKPDGISNTFDAIRDMSKHVGYESVLSEKMMLFFLDLCFSQTKDSRNPQLESVLNQSFQSLYYRWYYRRLKSEEKAAQEGSLYKHKDTDDAEADFRDLFPDYDDVMDFEGEMSHIKSSDTFEDIYYQIVEAYVSHYLRDSKTSLEKLVEQGGKLCVDLRTKQHDFISGPNTPWELSAILLSMEKSYDLYSTESAEELNFYHDPNPAQYKRAMKVVLSIHNAVAKLLAQWPEHATLQTIMRYTDEFLAYPSSFPLDKLLHKIEVIFNFMNEWEKFASSQVTLKSLHEEVTLLIVSWRRLELSSWKSIFIFEDLKFKKNLGKWWFHLFESIVLPYSRFSEDDDVESEQPSVVQILGALNIFMSETTYGEFLPRLELVKAFRNHISSTAFVDAEITNALSNFVTFYEQFLPQIEENISQTKRSLEKDVSEVILLASWKDVNIDALKQSSRRSHNNLFKVVRKYRALLSTPVSTMVQAGLSKDSKVLSKDTQFGKIPHSVVKTKDEKLNVLQTCSTVTSWNDRPPRLKNIDMIESNMKVYVDRISNDSPPSLYEYAKEVVEEMERLRKETPSVMNDDTKKAVAALRTQKDKFFSNTLKELRRSGIRTTVKPDVKKVLGTVNLILANAESFDETVLSGVDGHFFRCLDLLPRLRGSIATGNEEVPQPDLERGLAATENLMFSLVSTRQPIVRLARSVERFDSLHGDIKSIADNENHDNAVVKATTIDSLVLNLDQIRSYSFNVARVLNYAIAVCKASAQFGCFVKMTIFSDAIEACSSITSQLSNPNAKRFGAQHVDIINNFREFVHNLVDNLRNWMLENPQVSFIAEAILDWINNWEYHPFLNSSTTLTNLVVVDEVEKILRKLSSSIIVSVQKIIECQTETVSDEDDDWFATTQQRLMKSIKLSHHTQILQLCEQARDLTFQIEHNSETSKITSALFAFTLPLVSEYHRLLVSLLSKTKTNYNEVGHSTLIFMKSLHTLATDGFCSPEPPSEQKLNDNLQDGTGLGDGEGATNNSKDAEEDDDLTEHAQQPNEDQKDDDNEDDDSDAVDMQGDMAGDLENMSDQEKDDDEDNKDEEDEDLDEEIDDLDDLDPNAIDEKMWDEEAKDDKEKESDKPQDSSNNDDNIEANEDEEAKENDKNENKNEEERDDGKEKEENEEGDEGDEEEDVGEQDDEVKNDENEQLDEHVPETEALDLPEDMNLDNDEDEENEGSGDEEEFDDKMDVDDATDEKEEQTEQKEEDAEAAEANEEENADEDGNESDHELEEETGERGEPEEEPQDVESDEETLNPEQPEEKAPNEEDSAEQGEDNAEGADGADAPQDSEDVDMDSATKTEAGEKGDGAENQVMEEQDDIGASGAASTELKQEEDNKNEETSTEDSARDAMKESLKQLGDSMKEFHRRRQEIKEASIDEKENEAEDNANVKPDEFQHVDGENTKHETQALGAADDKDQVQAIDEDMAIDEDQEEAQDESEKPLPQIKNEDVMDVEDLEEGPEKAEQDADDFAAKTTGGVVGERREVKEEDPEEILRKAEAEDETIAEQELEARKEEDYVISNEDVPAMDLEQARALWRHSEVSTQELAAGLCEQLRLILEPTLATKLRGDYKTGKRLNMKRIIPYIASEFRKDKIWLRRTKPAKRQYQIMIAVDDSKSMSESKSTELAFHSIALVSKALTQLESGGLSVVRFGEDVKLVHPFDKPFNQETGANVFQWFDFQQERTDIKRLCSKSLNIFEQARATSNCDLWQLQIIISDGVCEDHETIQRLVRRAREEKVMLVFVVIDGITSNESILDMSQVSYVPDPVTGAMNLKVKNYLDTFPFEFYVVVRNINELPEMLSLILRQYFSEVANI